MVEVCYSQIGKRVLVGKKLAPPGGEGTVYEVDDSTVAKIYHEPPDSPKQHKLEAMIQNPPPTEDSNNNLALVWPKELLYDKASRLVGFTMRRVEDGQKSLSHYWNPGSFMEMTGLSRKESREKDDEVSKLLATIGRNFVKIVSSLHDRRYVLGDIKAENITVGLTGRIAVLDPDSFQIYDDRRDVTYRCLVGTPEYTDPNLMRLLRSGQCSALKCPSGPRKHGMGYGCVDRTTDHDNFAIAIVLFKLLMSGWHPFNRLDDTRDYPEKIMARAFPYKGPFNKCPRITLPRWKQLNSAWQEYFMNTFTTDRRYSAVEVLVLFEDNPPFSKPNLGDQIEVELGFSVVEPSSEKNTTGQTMRTTNNATGKRHSGQPTVSRQPNLPKAPIRQQPNYQSTERWGNAAKKVGPKILSNVTQCPQCHANNPVQSRCSNCQADLPPFKICTKPRCGNRMNVGAPFCSKCGSPN